MLDSIIDDLKKVLRRLEEYKQGQEEADLLSPNTGGYAERDGTTRSRIEEGMTGRRLFGGDKKRKTRKTRKRRYKK